MDDDLDMLTLYRAAAQGASGAAPPPDMLAPLLDAHQQALAVSRSVIERMREGHITVASTLAAEVLAAVVERVEAIERMLAARDPDARFTRDLDAFVEQYIGKLFDGALRMVEATGRHVTARAGEDIRADTAGGGEDETVDRMFGAVVLPQVGRVLRPVKGKDGKTRYTVEDPSGFYR